MKNLPNQLTIARIIMIFIFIVISTFDEKFPMDVQSKWRIAAYFFLILAGLTDFWDGYLARKYDLITNFGKLMDPLADKIFIVATFIVLVEETLLPGWVAIAVISREFLVTGLRMLAATKGEVISADKSGKLKLVVQMGFLIIAGFIWVGWIKLEDFRIFWYFCIGIVVIITVWSGVGYFMRHRRLFLENA